MTVAQTFYFVREDQPGQAYGFLLLSCREQGRNLKRANSDLQECLEKTLTKLTDRFEHSILASGRGSRGNPSG